MIVVKEKKYIPEILKLAEKIKGWDFDIEELKLYLENFLSHPALLVLLEPEKGFSLSIIYRDMIVPYVVILFAYVDPHYPDVSKKMFEVIKNWAKSYGIGVIRACVKRRIKAFKRKYGFKIEGVLMKLEV